MKQDLKDKYTQTYGCRFYSWQKKKFHAALDEDFKALGMEGRSEEHTSELQSR